MTEGNSRKIESNQTCIHTKLHELVMRYKTTQPAKPYSEHTLAAFDHIRPWLEEGDSPLILDSCCGVGQSTSMLARQFPSAKILGVDKSINRLGKHHAYKTQIGNYRLVRADLNDFWRLLAQSDIRFIKHFLLYPNPYPKSTQIQKRWYANAVMPAIMALSEELELRSNWRLYLEEFAVSASYYGFNSKITSINALLPLTPFEKKYQNSGQMCYQLNVKRANG